MYRAPCRFSVAFLAAILLVTTMVGCTRPKDYTPPSSAGGGPAPQPKATETFYPASSYAWLDDATALAVEHKGTVQYLGLDNTVKGSIELPPAYTTGSYKLHFGDTAMLLACGGDGTGNEFRTMLIDGKWQLIGGAIINRDGTVIQAFPTSTTVEEGDGYTMTLSDGRVIQNVYNPEIGDYIERAQWLDNGQLVLWSNSRLFFYDIVTNEVTLIDDFSAIVIPQGKMGVYYGINKVIPMGAGVLYLAFDIDGKHNTLGHVYYGDATGRKDILKGATTQNLTGNRDIAMLHTFTDTADSNYTKTTTITAYSLDTGLVEMGVFPGISLASGTTHDQRIDFEGNVAGSGEAHILYSYDLSAQGSGQPSQYSPEVEGMYQPELALTRKNQAGQLEFIYSMMNSNPDGQSKSYLYNQETGENTELKNYIRRWNDSGFFSSTTHFIDYNSDTSSLRLLPIE